MTPTAPARADLTLAAACGAFVVVPNVGAVLGGGERTDRYDTVITPPAYAFAIWAPIFAASAADAVLRFHSPGAPGDRATALPLAGAYALNTAWSVAAQADRFALTACLLPAATALTGLAHRRLQAVEDPRRSTAVATGLLLGWTALASTVNLAADAVRRGAAKESASTRAATAAGLVVAGGGVARVVATSRHGSAPLAASTAWGLLTTALDGRRPRLTRAVAGSLGALVVGAAVRSPAPATAPPRR